jgi:hypothetical protein
MELRKRKRKQRHEPAWTGFRRIALGSHSGLRCRKVFFGADEIDSKQASKKAKHLLAATFRV